MNKSLTKRSTSWPGLLNRISCRRVSWAYEKGTRKKPDATFTIFRTKRNMLRLLISILMTGIFISCAGMIGELPYNKPFQEESKIKNEKTVGVKDIPCENSISFDLRKKIDSANEARYYLVARVPAGFSIESMKMKVDKDLITLSPVSNSNVDYNLRESKIFMLEREVLEKIYAANELVFGLNGYSTYLEEQCIPTIIKMKNVNAKYGIEMFKSMDIAEN